MSSARYRLTCRLAAPPVEPAATERALRQGFGFTEANLQILMQGGQLVAAGLDEASAEKLRQRLGALGVETRLEREDDIPAATTPVAVPTTSPAEPADTAVAADAISPAAVTKPKHTASVMCPRCMAVQARSSTCVKCGVEFSDLPEHPRTLAIEDADAPPARPRRPIRPPAHSEPPSTAPLLSLAASMACAVLAAVSSIGCLASLRTTGTPGPDSAVVAAAGAGTLALWFAFRAARDSAGARRGRALQIAASSAGGVAALALALLVVILAGGLRPPPTPPDDRIASLRAAARAKWHRTSDSARGLSAPDGGQLGLRYPDSSDRDLIQGELSRLGTEGVERAKALLRRARGSLEVIACRYSEPEPAWSHEGQMVYRLVYRCECFDQGRQKTALVTLAVSFQWRDGSWVEGWPAGGPTESDAVSLFPEQ